jgi:diaminohydroxyphosphoribosylaminopyrimidine deaminase/5-amino-6-(5-phosphoribosylamino)uracil reductase
MLKRICLIPDHKFYMKLAIDEAWKSQLITYPNPAVGGVLLSSSNEILSISSHKKSGEPHSEVNVFKEAYLKVTGDEKILKLKESAELHEYLIKNGKNIFKGSTLYTTLEPCNHYGKTPPCSLLIQQLGVSKVIIGINDENEEASGGAEFLSKNGVEVLFLNSEETRNLFMPFKLWQQKRFVFFKYAQTTNGDIENGIISSSRSREFVHKIRDKIDLLVIGGNSVRIDRPILDSRIASGKAPDILIFSKQNKEDFDKSIPLFSVPNRKVYIENSLEKIDKYNFVMIEGGYQLLQEVLYQIDMLLVFIAPKIRSSSEVQFPETQFRILHRSCIFEDTLIWMKPN